MGNPVYYEGKVHVMRKGWFVNGTWLMAGSSGAVLCERCG